MDGSVPVSLLRHLGRNLGYMSASQPQSDLRIVFNEALLCALTEGRIGSQADALGSRTRATLQAIASNHPEASTDLINDAYNAWELDAMGRDSPE